MCFERGCAFLGWMYEVLHTLAPFNLQSQHSEAVKSMDLGPDYLGSESLLCQLLVVCLGQLG